MSVRPSLIVVTAVAITVLNALKPAVVDDTAYLHFARHLSTQPLDPYGWQLFWDAAPLPAMEVLLPPVLPYWLALGQHFLGENLFALKLWLFPFAWLLCRSVTALLSRFAPGASRPLFVVFATSPTFLPLFNVMLDIPALALGVAALATLMTALDRQQLWRCGLAGLLLGLAMQTKYSQLGTPLVFVAFATICHGSRRAFVGVAVAIAVAVAVFWGWEWLLYCRYGESHFWYHLHATSGESSPKSALMRPMLTQFGGMACGLSLVAGPAAGWPLWIRRTGAAFVILFFAVLALVPLPASLTGGSVNLPSLGFQVLGLGAVVTLLMLIVRVLAVPKCGKETGFLLAWIGLEVASMFALSPFPAARRLVGLELALTIFVARAYHLGSLPVERGAVALAVAIGVLFAGADYWDAFAEKELVEQASAIVQPQSGETVWYSGHWAFQYYCELHGMRPMLPGLNPYRPGDWFVLPLPESRFDRPAGVVTLVLPPDLMLETIAELFWEDRFRARTLPDLYGGPLPMTNIVRPRLRVKIGRAVMAR